jgi:hypothetical protein
MSRRTLGGIALALLTAVSLKAQLAPAPAPSPLEVSVKPTGQQRQVFVFDPHSSASTPEIPVSAPVLSADIQNVSDKCVIAVSLSTLDKNSEGKVLATGNASILRQRNGQFDCLASGQTVNHILLSNAFDESLRPITPEVSVDFVIFGDGSTWGPGKDFWANFMPISRCSRKRTSRSAVHRRVRLLPNKVLVSPFFRYSSHL